jgi:hypothetical protein
VKLVVRLDSLSVPYDPATISGLDALERRGTSRDSVLQQGHDEQRDD